MSSRGAAKNGRPEHFIEPHGRPLPPSRHSYKQLAEVLAETIRNRKRRWLLQATAVSIITDDRQGYKMLRFRCNHGTSFKSETLSIVRKSGAGVTLQGVDVAPALGIGGVPPLGVVTPLAAFDKDYSEADAARIWRLIEDFATPLNGAVDDNLLQHLRRCIAMYVSDGDSSAIKTGRLLKHGQLPRIAFLVRGPAHAVIIATKDPPAASRATIWFILVGRV